ncbi:MAG: NUDIX domain-containing protein [Chloroflexi bacterium]|nr:NUDIX domain-containing protein [Chloroflexota bacterium]
MSDKRKPQSRIRPVALAVIRDGSRLLVRRYTGPDGGRYYRPLGGAIEFGERAAQAVKREILEEIAAEIDQVRHLTTVENIFERDGERAHQIEFLFEAQLVDRSLYRAELINGTESSGKRIEAVWLDLSQPLDGPLYPRGLRKLLTGS